LTFIDTKISVNRYSKQENTIDVCRRGCRYFSTSKKCI